MIIELWASKPKSTFTNKSPLSIQIIVSGSGFSILLPHLCGMPTASISTFFHPIFKSKWAKNVDSHVKGKIIFIVQLVLAAFLSLTFRNPNTFSVLITADSFFKSLRCPRNYRRPDSFFLLTPLALITYSSASGGVEQKGWALWWGHSGCKGTADWSVPTWRDVVHEKIGSILKRHYYHLHKVVM